MYVCHITPPLNDPARPSRSMMLSMQPVRWITSLMHRASPSPHGVKQHTVAAQCTLHIVPAIPWLPPHGLDKLDQAEKLLHPEPGPPGGQLQERVRQGQIGPATGQGLRSAVFLDSEVDPLAGPASPCQDQLTSLATVRMERVRDGEVSTRLGCERSSWSCVPRRASAARPR